MEDFSKNCASSYQSGHLGSQLVSTAVLSWLPCSLSVSWKIQLFQGAVEDLNWSLVPPLAGTVVMTVFEKEGEGKPFPDLVFQL